ncbi:DMT family transporter [Oscillospiraceae bacterium N12]|jgi:drug/metabolite transporter (DMT)-like permease|uniref:DMT family transporter n=2 Tax=Jilunia laotingensis TaxID=2763675 RepID=A0A926FA31_9BACT|nr:DMT family transporter [Jilunia laotingensis]MBC8594709.1 DMT family transporter [Jilunia laotingensis]
MYTTTKSITWYHIMAAVTFLGVVASMLCYIMWSVVVKKLGAVYATNYIYVIPLVTLFISAIVIDEHITIVALIGSAFILSGVYLAER